MSAAPAQTAPAPLAAPAALRRPHAVRERVTMLGRACHNSLGMSFDLATKPAAEVLLVEDDEELRAEMAAYLEGNGYAVHQAGDVPAARRVLQSRPIQVAVLDVNLPGEDGLSLCRALSDAGGPAILMLSAQGESIDRILGLELGADDYVVKPITPRELLARVKALLRRKPGGSSGQTRNTYVFADFHLDLAGRKLQAPSGMILLLTRSELAILTALLNKAQQVVSRDDLTALLRGDEPDISGRSVDLHISRLRRKIQDQTDREIIRTYRGVGYLLDARVSGE